MEIHIKCITRVLWIFGHLYKKDEEIQKLSNEHDSELCNVMRLLISGNSNEARIRVVANKTIYQNTMTVNPPIDLYSALGDWMPIFRDLYQYAIFIKNELQ